MIILWLFEEHMGLYRLDKVIRALDLVIPAHGGSSVRMRRAHLKVKS